MFNELRQTGKELVELAKELTLKGILKFIALILLAMAIAPFLSYLVVFGCIIALFVMLAFITIKTGQGLYKQYYKEEKTDG